MFHLSRKTDYGLILILELLQKKIEGNEVPMSLNDIAKKYYISFFFLQKIAKQLREKGFIEAERGKIGGYRIAKEAQETTLYELFMALEGSVSIISCFNSKSPMPMLEKKCEVPAHKGLATVNEELKKLLTATKLKNFFKTASLNPTS
ncbi:MAG: Rrf2 family transcriptional regulator [Patescibacteria group bacterium]